MVHPGRRPSYFSHTPIDEDSSEGEHYHDLYDEEYGHRRASEAQPITRTSMVLQQGYGAIEDVDLVVTKEDDEERFRSQMEKDLERLAAKCSRLEAQNILVAVQQLDLWARLLAAIATTIMFFVYWGLLSLLAGFLLNKYAPDLTEGTVKAIQFSLCLVPIMHHKITDGMAHRRNNIYGVFIIIVFRIKMARWREEELAYEREVEGLIPRFGEDLNQEAVWDAADEITAQLVYISIRRHKGLWIKAAQYASSRADFMPYAFVRELSRLQDEAPATSWEEVQKIIKRSPKARDALRDIEEEPIASASMGQVHIAYLKKTGEKVVIKVQHPHASTLLTDDFRTLLILARVLTWTEPEYGFFELLMKEWAAEAVHELDFMTEASNLQSAKLSINNMEKVFGEKGGYFLTKPTESYPISMPFQVEIPIPKLELCTKELIVMTFCEGVRMDSKKVKEWGIPNPAMMDAMVQALSHLMYTSFVDTDGTMTSIFSGDPHAGNQLVRKGTSISPTEGFTLVLLDWGLAKRMPEMKRVAFCEMAYASATFDCGLLLDAFETLGLKFKREKITEDLGSMRWILRDIVPAEEARRRMAAVEKMEAERAAKQPKGEQVAWESKAYPGEFFFYLRANELMQGLGSTLDVTMPFLDLVKPYARHGLITHPLFSKDIDTPPPVYVSSDKKLHKLVQDTLNSLASEKKIAGAQVCVLTAKGEMLLNAVAGHMGGLKSTLPMRTDTLVMGFSATKAITATLAHMMVEQGYMTYDEPVCESIWPDFCPTEDAPKDLAKALDLSEEEVKKRWAWKRQITLRHILNHTAGMRKCVPTVMTFKRFASCEECCEGLEYNPEKPNETMLPHLEPGTLCEYHHQTFGWLAGGALMGACNRKHTDRKHTFVEVYDALMVPFLSKETLTTGFRPYQGVGENSSWAYVDSEVTFNEFIQKQQEASTLGEQEDEEAPEDLGGVNIAEMQEQFSGREFLLDARMWNSEHVKNANHPGAGGRFTATGLAYFYKDLMTKNMMSPERIAMVSSEISKVDSGASEGDGTLEGKILRGDYGYHIFSFDNDTTPSGFGHVGIGGTIGLYNKRDGLAVGIMLNKADSDTEPAVRTIKTVADYFGW